MFWSRKTMPSDERKILDPTEAERRRNEALARYDAHPGIALALLVVLVLMIGVAASQLVSDRLSDHETSALRQQTK
jgi:hypothetical protein